MAIDQPRFTGIPPHCAVLQQLSMIRSEQEKLVDTFVDKVKKAIDESGLTGNGVTEQRLQNMFQSFAQDLRQQLNELAGNTPAAANRSRDRVETGRGYRYHHYDGRFYRVPKDWRFPRIGTLDACRQWWVGDTVRSIPPLRTLKPSDLMHLDKVPLSAEEMHGRVGRNKHKRRPARKLYSDLSFLMNWITDRVEAAGGKRIVPKKLIAPEIGYSAVFEDTEGNRIALHSRN